MTAERTCITCERAFVLTPNKPGRINECARCGETSEVPRVQGNTIAEGKNTTYTEIKPAEEAAEFRRLSHVGSVRNH